MGKQLRESERESLAIVGIGLRLPMDSNNVEEFWSNLLSGKDGVVEVPGDRWNVNFFTDKEQSKAGKVINSRGGFLKEIDVFDNEFFNLAPYTCNSMDPQQRLLLEVTFEALQDAGLRLKDLSGSETSVYIGSFQYDHYVMALQSSSRDQIGSAAGLGTSVTSLANRISYHFNLKGPSVSLDTACSGSLVGFHLACQSIWNGEAQMGIAGGVNIIYRPETSIMLSKGGFLGASGLCKAFDSSADGYVRGEGAGIIIIKKLSDALANGDRIYALVEGTAINHDGFKREGYTVPSTEAQSKLLSTLYNQIGIKGEDIDYVECHGTGTKVGDPIEVNALAEIIGKNRSNECYIGSIKSNIGHLEGAAGVASVIKTVLVLQRKLIPPNLHLNNPREDLYLDQNHFVVPKQVIDLNQLNLSKQQLLAGVNSFGAGGANAHAVFSQFLPEKYPNYSNNKQKKENPTNNCLLFLLTEKSESALKLTVEKYVKYLKETTVNINDICYTLMKRKSLLSYQLIITGYTKEEIISLLEEYLQNKQHPQILLRQSFSSNTGDENKNENKLAFVYSGQGGQWIGMGKQLMEDLPLFKHYMQIIDQKFQLLANWSLLDELNNLNESTSKINETHVVQPLTIAIQIALTHIWKDVFGITPDAVVGHSIGEVAAAYASGLIDLDTTIFIIYKRSTIQMKLSGKGKMLAVAIDQNQANEYIEKYNEKISIATMNGPKMLTLAGDADVLDLIASDLESKHIFNAPVKTQVPYHTNIMEEIKDEMIQTFANIPTNPTKIQLYSSIYADQMNQFTNHYWYDNVRKPVLFVQTIEKMIEHGYKQFIEIGPHPVLVSGIKQLFTHLKITDALALCSLKRKTGTVQLYQNLGIYYLYNENLTTNGTVTINYDNLFVNSKYLFDLPYNTWEHKHFSIETLEQKEERLGYKYKGGHPFLRKDYQFNSTNTMNQIWEANININNAPYLVDHVVNNAIVFPAVGYIELAYAVGQLQEEEGTSNVQCFIEELTFESAIILPEEKVESIITRLEIVSPERDFIIYTKSQQKEDSNWTRHTSGKINRIDQFQSLKTFHFQTDIFNKFNQMDLVDIDEFYSYINSTGIYYGKSFQLIKQLFYNDGKILSKVILPDDISYEAKQYYFHPALFDAALHGLFTEHYKNGITELYLPQSLDKAIIYKYGYTTVYAYIEIVQSDEKLIKANTWIYNEDGELVCEFYGLTATNLSKTQSDNSLENAFEYQWIEKSFSSTTEQNVNTQNNQNLILYVDSLQENLSEQISKKLKENPNSKFNLIEIIDNENQLKNFLSNENKSEDLFVVYIPSSLSVQSNFEVDMKNQSIKYLNLIQLIQDHKSKINLRLITRNSCSLNSSTTNKDDQIKLDHVLLCGMCRVIQNEYPNLNVKFIDINSNENVDLIFNDLFEVNSLDSSQGNDSEIMYRNGVRYVRRLYQLNSDVIDEKLTKEVDGCGSYYTLEVKEKGLLDSLVYRQIPTKVLKSNEIEINTHAAGINFKDVLNVMGRLSSKAVKGSEAGNLLGLEVSGTIAAIGSNVKNFSVGDQIIAAAANAFSGKTYTYDTACIQKPSSISFVEGATMIIPYVTAYYGLKYLAHITNEDTVLIHSAAGGVGIACIYVAKYFGAKIFCTVSSKSKREFLEKEFSIPSEYIFDSRSTKFYDDIMNVTKGRGVDIVMNSLSGNLLDQTIKCLNSFGRFIEIGKSALYENKALALERFGNNISYFVEDIDRLNKQKPFVYFQILNELQVLFEQGHLKPLHLKEYSINDISSAFQYMMKGNHIGKLVVNMENQLVKALPQKQLAFPQDGAFIITGGTNGLGLTISKWLVRRGVRKVVLVSRSGIKSERDQLFVDQLKSDGVDIYVKKVNIKSNEEVEKLFVEVTNECGSIIGIVHSAATLRDNPIDKMSNEDFVDVIDTKGIGALNLHHASLKYTNTIKYFLMFSSVSSVIGQTAQINYVAANYFLDILSLYRSERNLPSTSVNLGSLGEYAGMLNSRNDTQGIGHILAGQGVFKMPLYTVENLLESTIIHNSPSRVTALLDWNKLSKSLISIRTDLRFSEILNNIKDKKNSNNRKGLVDKIIEYENPVDAIHLLKQEICIMFSKILNLSSTDISVEQSIDKLGFDSLSYTQVRTWILKNLNINYPIMKLMKGISILNLVQDLLKEIKSTTNFDDYQNTQSTSSTDQNNQTYSNKSENVKTTNEQPSSSSPSVTQKSSSSSSSSTTTITTTATINRNENVPKESKALKLENGLSSLANGVSHHHDDNNNVSTNAIVNNIEKSKERQSLSLDHAHILGIGTANIGIINYTRDVFKNIRKEYENLGISESDLAKVTSFYENCGIEKKYCQSDFTKLNFHSNCEGEYFNSKYKKVAPELAYQSSLKAIKDWGGDVKSITHVISCSCTGILVPDVNFLLIDKLGLDNTIERLSINMMGCFGGLTTLKTARALALQNPKNRILMVCTEVSSIHYRPLLEVDTMLGCAIFGDGSSAMIVGAQPNANEKAFYEIIETGAHHIRDTVELMSWDLTGDGWTIGLSPMIPVVFGDTSKEIVEKFIKKSISFPLDLNHCDWLMHPGGKNILLGFQETLNIPMEKNIAAWNVLREYGNMSSATILFVMDEARKRPPQYEYSMAVAFGPGLSVELALLRKL